MARKQQVAWVSIPSGQDAGVVPLTISDILINGVFAKYAFIYRHTLDAARLQQSLSHVLGRFPILAGRLVEDAAGRLHIDCQSGGVRFTTASSQKTLSEVAEEKWDIAPFVDFGRRPPPVRKRHKPLLYVRLTQMRDGGSVLGLCIAHLLADVSSVALFMRSWAQERRGCPLPAPIHTRALLDPIGQAEPAEAEKYCPLNRLRRLSSGGDVPVPPHRAKPDEPPPTARFPRE